MTKFSFTLSIEYILFTAGSENTKSAIGGARLDMDFPPTPKNSQPNFGMKLSILFTYDPFLLSY